MESTYDEFEKVMRGNPDEKPYRVRYGFSNFTDFATVIDALRFINSWRRPKNWKNDKALDDPTEVVRVRDYSVVIPTKLEKTLAES